MIHRLLGATTTEVRWFDRLAYAVSLLLLIYVAFSLGRLDTRITERERASAERTKLTDERYVADHTLLMDINTAREQRTVILRDMEGRIAFLEAIIAGKPRRTGGVK